MKALLLFALALLLYNPSISKANDSAEMSAHDVYDIMSIMYDTDWEGEALSGERCRFNAWDENGIITMDISYHRNGSFKSVARVTFSEEDRFIDTIYASGWRVMYLKDAKPGQRISIGKREHDGNIFELSLRADGSRHHLSCFIEGAL